MQITGSPSPTSVLRRDLEAVSRLLLVRLRSLGDSILSLPLIEALHSWRPNLKVDVLVESPFAPVFSHHPALQDTLSLRTRGARNLGGLARMRALAEVRSRRYGAVLNLHGGTTSALFTLASGARLRIGQESFRRFWAYNVRIPRSSVVWQRENLHTVEHQLTLLRWLGIPIPAEMTGTLHVEDKAQERVQDRLKRAGIHPGGYVLIQPTATLFTKQWPLEKFAQLADFLSRRYSLPTIFTAASHESQALRDIAKKATSYHRYWWDLGLDDLFALIAGCRLFVGNDSGPTHAASALHRPVVVVWGSSNFRAWHPWGTEHDLIRSDLPCIPCPGYSCAVFGAPKCILEITVDRVVQACERVLARTPPTLLSGHPSSGAPPAEKS